MAVLGSGSAGNATLIQCGQTTILVDAGLSAKQLNLRMAKLGVTVTDLDAVLLTHEHSDHSKGIKVLLKEVDTPVYANALTKECIQHKMGEQTWKVFQSGTEFEIAGLTVRSFAVPHDAQEPVGYVISNHTTKVGVVTDVGYATNIVREALSGLDGLFLEANYDEKLLEDDIKRPWSIKQRISSKHGHLSNEQAADLYADIACSSLKALVVGHLSSDCNTESHVRVAFEKACKERDKLMPNKMICATQNEPTEWLVFGGELNQTMSLGI